MRLCKDRGHNPASILGDNLYELGVIPAYQSDVPGHKGLGLLEGSVVSLERAIIFAADNEEQDSSEIFAPTTRFCPEPSHFATRP